MSTQTRFITRFFRVSHRQIRMDERGMVFAFVQFSTGEKALQHRNETAC